MEGAKYAEYLLKNHRIIKKEIEIMEMELRSIPARPGREMPMGRRAMMGAVEQAVDSGWTNQQIQGMVDTARNELEKLEKAIEMLDDRVKEVIMDLYIYRLNWSQASSKRYVSMNTLNRRRKKGIDMIAEAMAASNLKNLAVNAAKEA